MKTLALSAAALGIWLAIGSHPGGTSLSPSRVATERSFDHPSNYELTDVVQQYCVRCHNDAMRRGNLSLSDFDVGAAVHLCVLQHALGAAHVLHHHPLCDQLL